MNRRVFLGASVSGIVGVTAGCLSGIIDDETTFEASPVRVSPAAVDETDYEHIRTEERVEQREYEGESYEETSYVSEYAREVEHSLEDLESSSVPAVVSVVSTPTVVVAGEELETLADRDPEVIAESVQDGYEEFDLENNVGGRAVEVDDLEIRVSFDTYAATATVADDADAEIDCVVDVVRFDAGEDSLVTIGIYPDDEALELSDEQGEVDTLLAGLEHGEDVDVDIDEETEIDHTDDDE
ncbi:DUF6517 family protein [Natronorubrum daqingense]|uniref:Uncharacterized protein n=1 Tax=Natronorubrum daqingense TaxID=588898 RepID=A0A1N6X896_9EURY|nr:DUF6517 family protein [Natronorubrum daqingense]APX96019.1 hypothetical protein BB347_04945 [Natronorubrum daqingense]SIQ98578.1 hypothetical protein SAMN05421809_0042 [Natronorubrum daqingense]